LTLLGFVVYFSYFWDALTDIGISGLLALFLIDKGPRVRAASAALFLALFQVLFTCTGYGAWQMEHSLNGGPLGPLSWASILLLGTLAYDWLTAPNRTPAGIIRNCLAWGVALSALGWALKIECPT